MDSGLKRYKTDEATGVLVIPGDVQAMAFAIEQLLSDDSLRRCLGENAALDVAKRFDLQRQPDAFLAWYQEIVNDSTATFSNEAIRPLPLAEVRVHESMMQFALVFSGNSTPCLTFDLSSAS